MNYYLEGRQARRNGDYQRAWDLYSQGTDAGCLECAFELVVWGENCYKTHKQAYDLCLESKYNRFMCFRGLDEDLFETSLTSPDMYIRGMALRYFCRDAEADQCFYLSWKQDGNPHAAFEYEYGYNIEALEFAAAEGLHEPQMALVDQKVVDEEKFIPLFLSAIEQGNKSAIDNGIHDSFGKRCGALPENWRFGAYLVIYSHTLQLYNHQRCVMNWRMSLRVEKHDWNYYNRAIELYEYGKFLTEKMVPVCICAHLDTTEAVNIYRNTKTHVRGAVLCWMWINLLPRDLMRLIGQKYVWDTSHNDPNVWAFLK